MWRCGSVEIVDSGNYYYYYYYYYYWTLPQLIGNISQTNDYQNTHTAETNF